MKKFLAFILLISCLLAGCRSVKDTVTTNSSDITWTQLTLPFKLNVSNGMSLSGRGYFVKDESIYLSVRYFGIEVLSFFCNSDTCYLYDKTHGMLIESRLGNNPITGTSLSVESLQNLLLGNETELRPFDIRLGTLIISLTPNYTKNSSDINRLDSWNAAIFNQSDSMGLNADLIWNYSNADMNPDNLPQWKMPKNPKRILVLDELYYLLLNQF